MVEAAVKELAQGPNYAALTTLSRSGQPVTHIVWVHADDEHLFVNTEVERQKFQNIERDPRVSLAIIDATNPYHYAEVRGRVVSKVRGEAARANIDELSRKYTNSPYARPIGSERVILEIAPERQRVQ